MKGIVKTAAVLLILLGFYLQMQGYEEGYTVIKFGLLFLAAVFIVGSIKISRHSRGSY